MSKEGGARKTCPPDATNMKKKCTLKRVAKGFITGSVILFSISLTGPGSEFLWGFLKPLSALLFVAFFITNLLALEYAEYDEEYAYRMALAKENGARRLRETEVVPGRATAYELRPQKA